jgi:hypothetical protein
MTGRPFLDHTVKRQSGVLWLAAEGQDEVELRAEALIREKCGQMPHAEVPFRWRDTVPRLLEKGAIEQLTAIAQQAEAELAQDHELPLGLIIVDTITSCAGYSHRGDENDNAVATAMTIVLQTLAQNMKCFVLAVAHLSDTGIRGGKSKEEITDVIWACLSDHEFGTGPATNTRLVVEKNRGGKDGMVFPYTLRLVKAPEKDEDGDPITTRVVDWLPPQATQEAAWPDDPWLKGCRTIDQRANVSRFKRVLLETLAEHGAERPIPVSELPSELDPPIGPEVQTPSSDTPTVRMVDQRQVRAAFDLATPQDDRRTRYSQFKTARDWAEQLGLLRASKIDDTTYLWLAKPEENG